MKRAIGVFVFAAIIITLSTSCKKVITSLFPGINVRIPDVQLTVPPVLIVPGSEMSLGTYTASYNLDSVIKASTNNVFNINDIASVKVKEVTVTLQNGDNLNNLSNFESARVVLSTDTNGSETNLVSMNFPDAAATSMTVSPSDSPDLKQYLVGNTIHYTVYGKVRRPTTKSLNMVVSITVRVE
jgi:hypothetical protein